MSDDKDNAGIITHPPVFYLIAAAIAVAIDMYIYPLEFPASQILKPLGVLIFLSGVIIMVFSAKMFLKSDQDFNVHSPTTQVYQSGLYGYTRNPIYLGATLILISAAPFFNNVWLLIILAPLIVVINKLVIEKEEAYLEGKFGDEYRAYKKKVRRWI